MARIRYTESQVPIMEGILGAITFTNLGIANYAIDTGQALVSVPNQDLAIDQAEELVRRGISVEAYPMFFEIPDANLGDDIPAGVSFETYFDDQEPPVEQTRTWADLTLQRASDVSTTVRFWQPSNNGEFIAEDKILIEEAGFTVYGRASLDRRYQNNTDFPAPVGEENPITIEQVDQTWRTYHDFVAAHNEMKTIYEAKGIDDNARWAASTTAEQRVLVRWNQVGKAKAATLAPGGWSEGRTAKELAKKYREFNRNIRAALIDRFDDWYHFALFALAPAKIGDFKTNFNNYEVSVGVTTNLKDEYLDNFLRHYELGGTNALVDFNDTVLGSYGEGDWSGSIPAATIVDNLNKVLTDDVPPV